MIHIFESLPGWIVQIFQALASWAIHNPLTFMTITVIAVAAAICVAQAAYQSVTRRADRRRAASRYGPGSFPGDNR